MKLAPMVTLFIGLIYLMPEARSDQRCSKIDHRPKLPPVRDQMNTQWCYAYTTADLYSFHLGQNISPIGVGIRSYEFDTLGTSRNETTPSLIKFFNFLGSLNPRSTHSSVKTTRGGSMGEASWAAREKRLCLESELPTIGFRTGSIRQLQDTTAAFLRRIQSARKNLSKLEDSNADLSQSCDEFDDARILSPAANPHDLRKIVRASSSAKDPLIKIADLVCLNGPIVPSNLRPESKDWSEPEAARNYIQRNLSSGPIGISYNDKVLKTPNASYRPSNHASSIVARELVNGQCEYWIRNSWGDCDEEFKRFPCQDGNYRVPENELSKMVSETTLLRN